MSEVKVNKISPRTNCGTVQLGDSGDTITIPAGATITNNGTQTGFGRTGTVDWQTGSIKTGDFTAANGEGYFVNTTSGAITVTLPASPSAGNIVSISDYAKTSANNNITIARNGSPIDGGTDNLILATTGIAVTLVYVDAVKGWKPVNSNEITGGPKFVVATVSGACNTLATSGDFKIATFKGPGTFCVSCAGNAGGSNSVEYVVVAGGGGGGGGSYGSGTGGFRGSGGGGAGGFRVFSNTPTNPGFSGSPANPLNAPAAVTVTVSAFPVTVGGGGTAGPGPGSPRVGGSGSNSSFSTITAHGGGGGSGCNAPCSVGAAGGSGGGSGANAAGGATGAAGNTPPVSPPQGNPGGDGIPSAPNGGSAGGGGGARAAGTDGTPSNNGTNGGAGGVGAGVQGFGTTGVNCGSNYFFSGGGGGGNFADGGTGGGGKAGRGSPAGSPQCGTAGTANTGGGGGGTGGFSSDGEQGGGAGGSGIVILRYKFQ